MSNSSSGEYRAPTRPALVTSEGRIVATGGLPPHDPPMEARVSALEAGIKDVKAILGRMEPMLARMDERSTQSATKTDIAELGGRVDGLEFRLKTTEQSVSTALSTAIGKAIGPLQFIQIIAGSVVVFGAGFAAYKWLLTHT